MKVVTSLEKVTMNPKKDVARRDEVVVRKKQIVMTKSARAVQRSKYVAHFHGAHQQLKYGGKISPHIQSILGTFKVPRQQSHRENKSVQISEHVTHFLVPRRQL